MRRERFYECTFVQERNEYRFHVRAWSPEDAAEHLRAALRDDGVREAGTLLVRDRKGSVVAQREYELDDRQ